MGLLADAIFNPDETVPDQLIVDRDNLVSKILKETH